VVLTVLEVLKGIFIFLFMNNFVIAVVSVPK
jgi:hypothetical protein